MIVSSDLFEKILLVSRSVLFGKEGCKLYK